MKRKTLKTKISKCQFSIMEIERVERSLKIMKHYFIQDITNKKLALQKKGHPCWMNDSIQFNRYGDESITANIQTYDIETGKESNATVMIHLEDLKNAYEVLNEKATPPEVALLEL